MKMGRGVCAHLRSFFLFLYQSGSVPVATKGATLLEIVYTRHRDALCLCIVPPFHFSLPYPLIVIYLFLENSRLETLARETHTDVLCGPPINKKTFSRVFFDAAACNEQKVSAGKKGNWDAFVFGHRSR